MKKLLCVVLSVALVAAFSLTGCGGSESKDNTAEIKAAVEGFLSTIQKGDYDNISEYGSEELLEKGGDLESLSLYKSMTEEFSKGMGIDESDLSDDAKKALQKFMDTLATSLVKSYEIGEITESDGAADVDATLEYGMDPDKFGDIDVDKKIEDLAAKYMEDNMDELMKVVEEKGEEGAQMKMINDLMDQMLTMISDEMLKTGGKTEQIKLHLENQDGKWKVTSSKALAD